MERQILSKRWHLNNVFLWQWMMKKFWETLMVLLLSVIPQMSSFINSMETWLCQMAQSYLLMLIRSFYVEASFATLSMPMVSLYTLAIKQKSWKTLLVLDQKSPSLILKLIQQFFGWFYSRQLFVWLLAFTQVFGSITMAIMTSHTLNTN